MSRRPITTILALLGATLAALLAALPALAASGGSGLSPFPPAGVSPNGQHIRDLYDLISLPAIAIFLLVEILLLVIILRFRRSRLGSAYRPPQWHGNTRLEILWTVVPLVIVLAIGALSFAELQRDFAVSSNGVIAAGQGKSDLEIGLTAYQFGWRYDYPQGFSVSTNGFDSPPMVVPVGRLVRVRISSRDVIHSWWVPGITGKTDAVPGYDNFTWFKIDQPGEWRGQCAELCGVGHYTMVTYVKAVPPADFDAWAAEQTKKASPSPPPSPAASPPR